jgi:ethylbenzene dioxygenase beta subunit
MFHLDEDRDSLELRVDRLGTGFAWAEEPPSRIRHFVSNVRVEPVEGSADEVAVRSSVLIYRSRWDRAGYDLLSGERHDILRRMDTGWQLARRRVILDNTTLPTLNLSFFI